MGALVVFLFLATMALTTNSSPTETHLVLPSSSGVGLHIPVYCKSWRFGDETKNVYCERWCVDTNVYCKSWRFGVETNNVQNWSVVPPQCADYVAIYMESYQYESDCVSIVNEAIKYVDGLKINNTRNDTWVFDIDETALSNLEYYRRKDVAYGAVQSNMTKLKEWWELGNATALKPVLKLYEHLISKNVKIVFLTGVPEYLRTARERNLEDKGYGRFDKLILKSEANKDLRGAAFKEKKRKELEEEYKYSIIGNIGDQWSDISGTNVGKRTFKLPNPMYYL